MYVINIIAIAVVGGIALMYNLFNSNSPDIGIFYGFEAFFFIFFVDTIFWIIWGFFIWC